jgi:hypothetical protein
MKSIIKKMSIATISCKLSDFFSTADAMARQTKFAQRMSPLGGRIFLQTLVFGFLKNAQASLNQLAQTSAKLGVPISPQGFDQRINAYAVDFVKAMYLQAFEQFKNQQALPIKILKQFSKLWVVDSTFKQLPESMASEFPGSGGKGSKASLKLQLVFEFLYGNLAQLVVQAGRAADQAFTQYLDLVQAGSLVLMDLGYFRLASLRAIADQGAYFIIRYHYPTALCQCDGTPIPVLPWLQTKEQQLWEAPIWLGASPKLRLACRLIVTPVSLAVAEERRRKAQRNAQKHGKTLTASYLSSLGWSIFLTNVPVSMLATPQVITFYRIRWQIELLFKLWKSDSGLESNLAARQTRVLTEFYAKLLTVVLTTFCCAPLRIPDEAHSNREISPVQVRKILADFAQDIASQLRKPTALLKVLEHFYQSMARFGFKQIRCKKPNIGALLSDMSIPSTLLA